MVERRHRCVVRQRTKSMSRRSQRSAKTQVMKGHNMNREVCKFFSGSFAALAWAHAAYAVATSRGVVDEPIFLGRNWGVGYMWTETALYSAASLALGYVGWGSKSGTQVQEPTKAATDGSSKQPVGSDDQPKLVSP